MTILLLATALSITPAERLVTRAEQGIEKNPQRHEAYNELALALARRARETADPTFYDQAERAIQRSFALSPGNFDGRKAQVWVLLGGRDNGGKPSQKANGGAYSGTYQTLPDLAPNFWNLIKFHETERGCTSTATIGGGCGRHTAMPCTRRQGCPRRGGSMPGRKACSGPRR